MRSPICNLFALAATLQASGSTFASALEAADTPSSFIPGSTPDVVPASVVEIVKPTYEYSTSNRVGCVAEMEGYFFDLKELSLPINLEDRAATSMYQLEFQDVNGTSTIEFNFCGETVRRCPDMQIDYANIINSVGTCNHLSRVEIEGEQKPGTLSLISEKNPAMGIMMAYEGGNQCNETSKFSLNVQVNCNPNLDKTTFALDKESLKNTCDPKVIMNSPHACPVISMGPLGKAIEDYKYYLGIPMLAIGAYLSFVGGRFPGTTLFIFSTLAVTLIQLFAIFILVLPNFVPSWTVPVVGFVCLGMGLGMGYGAAKWPKIGVMIMGFSIGSLIGFLVYYAFISSSVETTTAKTITMLVIGLFTAIMYLVFFDYMVIITSAIFGSYILIRGLTMYTGGYVNEFTVLMASNNGDLGDVEWTVYLFWILMGFLIIGSINAQLKDRRTHLEAYQYKFHQNSQFDTYRSMRERITRLGGKNDYDSAGDISNQYEDEDEAPLHPKMR